MATKRQHSLYSQNEDMPVKWFDNFDKEVIKSAIIDWLTKNPKDVVEHCKEFSPKDIRVFSGNEILGFYGVNPKNGKPSRIITKGDKDYYKAL